VVVFEADKKFWILVCMNISSKKIAQGAMLKILS
jgi:hypothetical protein